MKRTRSISVLTGMLLVITGGMQGQQISISRIDLMPNAPSPYLMRNWKQVALGYDSLVFNAALSGRYLPLSKTYTATTNYPGQISFGMESYVGGTLGNGEAINCLPAVVGASLVGVDKSNQSGTNWVQMCQEWFNKANGENVYLNSAGSPTGDDWWYETMPNVFFYQLYSMYPGTTIFPGQFVTVANRWLAAVRAMGGSSTPWSLPNTNHRAFDLMTMTPNNVGVVEPEAAGAIAWLLYNAWRKTGNQQFRVGAELAMEALVAYPTDPSYELQLPYGTYLAARMNAELGTGYDLTKLLTWCFSNGDGTLRQWGVTVGYWGGLNCSGLIGEINHANDYPFFMNTVEQIGALVPLVRYDDRYASAIGKWVLNAANASRLFYANYMDDAHQDSAAWAHQYDPNAYIAHEAMHQYSLADGAISPFATGDAAGKNWAQTNFALYGSSHVGILGGIIDTTNVAMILRLDVLKTDYFHDTAYATYLYYNPFATDAVVTLNVGAGSHDLYSTVTKSFLALGVTGLTSFPIPASSAVVVVVAPGGGMTTYDLDRTLINGVVVDYRSGLFGGNYPPRIKSLSPDSSSAVTGKSLNIYCTATDRNGDSLGFSWIPTGGTITGTGAQVQWTAPGTTGTYTVSCTVSDGHGGQASAVDTFQVVQRINYPPAIQRFNAVPRKIDLGTSSTIKCAATDANGDTLTYAWSAASGSLSGSGATIQWTAPSAAGNYFVRCSVTDGYGGSDVDSVGLEVRDLSVTQSGALVAYYPFNGNADDATGHGHNGTVNNAVPVSDRLGHPASAYSFNGTTASIVVPSDTGLNFQNSISVNYWMKVGAFYTGREQYPISHGNWQNRWKFSISPVSNKLRWTLKIFGGQAKDLDAETSLSLDSLYNVTGVYNGADFELYLNGQLDAFTSFSGLINQTPTALSIGQDVPGDNNYNFNGVLDDIRIYNYALSLQDIAGLAVTSVSHPPAAAVPTQFVLEQDYPNPFNPTTVVRYQVPVAGNVRLIVYDLLGREVATLVNERKEPGSYTVRFDASGLASGAYLYRLQAGGFAETRKMILIK
jgi:hypothetical protein